MKRVTLFIASLTPMLASLMAYAEQQAMSGRPCLVPWPRELTTGAGSIVLPAALAIESGGDDLKAAARVAGTLARDLHGLGFRSDPAGKSPKIILRISPDKTLGSEGYRLAVNDDVEISADTEKGLFWGTRTAIQLAAKGPGSSVPRMTIRDRPEFWYRALLVDVARQFHSIEFHRRTIKRLAQYKVAFYQIHFSDNESYTLPSKKFPSLPTPGRHYSKAELEDLVRLAAQYHVTIVPEIEMPGHASALCRALPELVCRGKKPGGMICGGSEKSFETVTALIAEAMDIFPGPFFHIGADECHLRAWEGCPDCSAVIAAEGLKGHEGLYSRFINRVNRFVKSKGRRTIVWEGFKVGHPPIIDKDVLVMEFENRYALPADLMNAGYDLINASWSPLYVVGKDATSPEGIAEWDILYFGKGRPPKPLAGMIKVDPTDRLKGMCMCSWENEERAEEPMLFGIGPAVVGYAPPGPRVQIMAERAWTGASTSKEDLLQRVGSKADVSGRGQYFARKAYAPKPLPKFTETRSKLPGPIYDEDPACVEMYWKAWELAFRNFHEPAQGSGYVSQFIDAAFNQNIFLWDTCFMTMFCNYGHPYVPGIGSLDNFYCKQFEDGEICREINRATGKEFREWVNREREGLHSRWSKFKVTYVGREAPQPPPHLTLDALNHPILAWAEMESFRLTADRARLGLVYEPLVKYYRALQKYIRQGNGLYMTDWASMDNSPRNEYLTRGGTAVDTSSQMVLFARNLAEMADLLDKKDEARAFRNEADELAQVINGKMWDPDRKFYFDLTVDGKRSPVKTIAAFWTLMAGVAGPEQAAALSAELRNPKTFGRKHRVPTVPADEPAFKPAGGYWQGAVWAPTNTMVIRGLEKNGQPDLAGEIALEHLRIMTEVFQETGTIWENYAPDAAKPGVPAGRDFVGWSGIGPIMYLIEYGVGVRADAPANTITWTIRSPRRVGVERLWFGGKTVSLVCEELDAQGRRFVRVASDGAFHLKLIYGSVTRDAEVAAGRTLEMVVSGDK